MSAWWPQDQSQRSHKLLNFYNCTKIPFSLAFLAFFLSNWTLINCNSEWKPKFSWAYKWYFNCLFIYFWSWDRALLSLVIATLAFFLFLENIIFTVFVPSAWHDWIFVFLEFWVWMSSSKVEFQTNQFSVWTENSFNFLRSPFHSMFWF